MKYEHHAIVKGTHPDGPKLYPYVPRELLRAEAATPVNFRYDGEEDDILPIGAYSILGFVVKKRSTSAEPDWNAERWDEYWLELEPLKTLLIRR